MPQYSSITLIGHLGHDPSVRQAGDTQVANFTLAVSDKVKGEEITSWYDCACFGRQSDVLAQYVKKGDPLMVQGKPRIEQYQAKDGTQKTKVTVNVREFALLGSKRDGNEQDVNVTQVTHTAPVTKPAGPGLADEIKAKLADAKAAQELRAKAVGKAADQVEPPF